jgi:acetolactate synthase-1/2/3 large subunit
MPPQSGGELVARMLQAEGVEVVFGIIDGSYFGLTSSLEKHGIRLVSPRHESSAAHMAGAYARLTGRLGVCIASNGPGAANVLPGIAVENGEGNRVLVLTSWRRAPIVGPDRGGTYQYFDQVAVTRPMTKWAGAARSFERIPEVLRRAFRVSFQGRPGVVHVTVPEDVLNGAAARSHPRPTRCAGRASCCRRPACPSSRWGAVSCTLARASWCASSPGRCALR